MGKGKGCKYDNKGRAYLVFLLAAAPQRSGRNEITKTTARSFFACEDWERRRVGLLSLCSECATSSEPEMNSRLKKKGLYSNANNDDGSSFHTA